MTIGDPAPSPPEERALDRRAASRSSGPARRTRRRVRPERRRWSDALIALALTALLVAGVAVLWRTSTAAATVSRPAGIPIAAPPDATALPDRFVEAWRAPSAATATPVVAGPAVVTADGSTVVGRDARSGVETWSYRRDLPLCTVGAGFPAAEGGSGRVLAYYRRDAAWCSELTALRPATGERVAARNPDVRPGSRLLASRTLVAAAGPDAIEVVRSDLVKTLEYGATTTPEEANGQPRSGCAFGSVALVSGRLGVVERCPGDATDRLTVLDPDSDPPEVPDVEFTVLLPRTGATLVALSAERVAVALPNPARLLVVDRTGQQVAELALDVPDADLAADPPGRIAAVEVADPDPTVPGDAQLTWWTGSRTVALDPSGLIPLWTLPDTLGPGVLYAGSLVIPVPGGLAEVDRASGAVLRTLPVLRADADAPVRLAVQGEVLLEQRETEVTALVP